MTTTQKFGCLLFILKKLPALLVGTAPDLVDFGPEFTRYFNEVSKRFYSEANLKMILTNAELRFLDGFQAR